MQPGSRYRQVGHVTPYLRDLGRDKLMVHQSECGRAIIPREKCRKYVARIRRVFVLIHFRPKGIPCLWDASNDVQNSRLNDDWCACVHLLALMRLHFFREMPALWDGLV